MQWRREFGIRIKIFFHENCSGCCLHLLFWFPAKFPEIAKSVMSCTAHQGVFSKIGADVDFVQCFSAKQYFTIPAKVFIKTSLIQLKIDLGCSWIISGRKERVLFYTFVLIRANSNKPKAETEH